MASGFTNKIIGQTGEFAVCAQLGKLGLVATPFAGNLPHFDVIAINEELKSVPIQVKATHGNSTWMGGQATDWMEIELCPTTGKQTITGLKAISHANLITVYVWLSKQPGGADRFFVMTKDQAQIAAHKGYSEWLAKHQGIRPKKQDSYHLTIAMADLLRFENNWQLVLDALT